jgi:hypothetical protein
MTGFKRAASKCEIIPGGQTGNLYVERGRHFEVEQPQDFVQGIPDDQTVPIPRSRQVDQFMLVSSNVAQPASVGASAIVVYSSAGMSTGDTVQIMLDSGENFTTTLVSIAGNTLGLAAPLPAPVGSLVGDPPENIVLDLTAARPALNWPIGSNLP